MTTGLGSIQLHGPSGMIVWLTGDQSYAATLAPGEYRIFAGVSAIADSGSVSFTVPSRPDDAAARRGTARAAALRRERLTAKEMLQTHRGRSEGADRGGGGTRRSAPRTPKRAIRQRVENPLAARIRSGDFGDGDSVIGLRGEHVYVQEGK